VPRQQFLISFGSSLTTTPGKKAMMIGIPLFLIVTIPGIFVMFTSMNYPPDFYLAQFPEAVIGYP